MAGTADEKARGAFFTPVGVADYLADWAIRSSTDAVLEPSCGEAVFLSAAGRKLRSISPAEPTDLNGVELHAASAVRARKVLTDSGFDADVQTGDFFLHTPSRAFDVILGNPPFIRYQDFSGAARARSVEAALAQGVRLSGLSSSWAAFVVKASQHLKPNGRMALVLPAELLTVGYAAEVRRFLMRRFAKLRLVTFEERIFPGVLEDVVLLLAEGSGGADRFELHQTRNSASLKDDAASWVEYAPAGGDKWTPALVAESAFASYEDMVRKTCEPLSSWGSTYLGSVTGNNKYFTLSRVEANDLGIPPSELIPISPPGSRHLRGLTFDKREWVVTADAGLKCYLFRPTGEPSDASDAYIVSGHTSRVDAAYKCRVRSPWWRVPVVDVPDLLLTYMNHERPRLIANKAGVRILNSLYGVRLMPNRRKIGMDLLPIACLNSVTLLGAEVVGRAYGGGLLKLEPREADKLPVPSLSLIAEKANALRAIRPQLNTALRNAKLEDASRLIDPILFADTDPSVLDALRVAREFLFQRRRSRAGNGAN